MINPEGAKLLICGLQGSGKTHASKWIVKHNKMKVLVFSPHWHDFKDESNNFYFYENFGVDQFDQFLKQAKALCQKGIIDGIFVDEFDTILRSNFQVSQIQSDIFANHRHYNMAFIAITRRPQDIPAYFVESCKYIISFALQGDNVKKKFNSIYPSFGDMITSLDYKSREFLLKEIGEAPKKCNKLK